MSDALPLPPRPNLEQYRKLAKDFQRACKSSQPSAIRDWAHGGSKRSLVCAASRPQTRSGGGSLVKRNGWKSAGSASNGRTRIAPSAG